MQTHSFTYMTNGLQFKGIVYRHPDGTANRPTMLIYHAFEGMNDIMTNNAKRCLKLGMNAITLDVYGEGAVMETLEDCMTNCMNLINDRATLHTRLLASVDAAKTALNEPASPCYAMGFCFGGLCVLDLARLGADLSGVVSVHGVLAPPADVTMDIIKAKVLACHGYDDPQIPPEQISEFMQEMNNANADWTFVTFGHTKHAFTDPDAHKIGGPEMGREFNAQSTERMWQTVKNFTST